PSSLFFMTTQSFCFSTAARSSGLSFANSLAIFSCLGDIADSAEVEGASLLFISGDAGIEGLPRAGRADFICSSFFRVSVGLSVADFSQAGQQTNTGLPSTMTLTGTPI